MCWLSLHHHPETTIEEGIQTNTKVATGISEAFSHYAIGAGRVPDYPKTRTENTITRSYPKLIFNIG